MLSKNHDERNPSFESRVISILQDSRFPFEKPSAKKRIQFNDKGVFKELYQIEELGLRLVI